MAGGTAEPSALPATAVCPFCARDMRASLPTSTKHDRAADPLSYDGLMATDQPRPPDPAAFNLTKERLAAFEDLYGHLATRLLVVMWVITSLVFAPLIFRGSLKHVMDVALRFETFGYTLDGIFLVAIWLVFAFVVAAMVALPAAAILALPCKWTRGDYTQVRQYKRALAQYKAEYAEWLKTHRAPRVVEAE
jgi:hypothetical protein